MKLLFELVSFHTHVGCLCKEHVHLCKSAFCQQDVLLMLMLMLIKALQCHMGHGNV